MSTAGDVEVSVPAGAAADVVGNGSTASTSTDASVTYDFEAPTVTVEQAEGQLDPTNASPVRFAVVFSEPVSGFTAEDVSLAGSTEAGSLTAAVTGGPTEFEIAVSGMTTGGTVVASVPGGAAVDALGNSTAASTSTDDTVAYDGAAPSVTLERAAEQADPTNVGPVRFTAVFSEPVDGFTASDVSFEGSAEAASLTAVVTGGPTSYDIAVSGMTASGDVVASVPADAATDAAGNGSTASTSVDATVAYDIEVPTVTIEQSPDQADPTNAAPVRFAVTFSEAVTGFTGDDLSFEGSTEAASLTAVVTGGPTAYEVAVSGMTASGDVVAGLPAGAASDAAGNASGASTATDATVAYDVEAPTVTVEQAVEQADPTNAGPVRFTVTTSEAVSGLTAEDLSFEGSTEAEALTAVVTGGPAAYDVAVSGMATSGTVVLSVPAGAATDAAGNASDASTATDGSVVFDVDAPTVTVEQAADQADPTNEPTVRFVVSFSEAVGDFTAEDLSFEGSTEAGSLSAVVTEGPDGYEVTVTGMSQASGVVVLSVPAGGASDAAGNANQASTSTDASVAYEL
jgi:hypothetical protein